MFTSEVSSKKEKSMDIPIQEAMVAYKKCILQFELASRGYMLWNTDYRDAWLCIIESCSDIEVLCGSTIDFVKNISPAAISSFEEIMGRVTEVQQAPSLEPLISLLLFVEVSIQWDYVIDSFKESRNEWVDNLYSALQLISPEESVCVDAFSKLVNGLLFLFDIMTIEMMCWSQNDADEWRDSVVNASSLRELGILMNNLTINITSGSEDSRKNVSPQVSDVVLRNPTVYDLARCLLNVGSSIDQSIFHEKFQSARDGWISTLQSISYAELCEIPSIIQSAEISSSIKTVPIPNEVSNGDKITFGLAFVTGAEVDVILYLLKATDEIVTIRISRTSNKHGIQAYSGEEILCDSSEEWPIPLPVADSYTCSVEILSGESFRFDLNGEYVMDNIYLPSDLLHNITSIKVGGIRKSFTLTSLNYSFYHSINLLC